MPYLKPTKRNIPMDKRVTAGDHARWASRERLRMKLELREAVSGVRKACRRYDRAVRALNVFNRGYGR
jgi:hypothetical protein